VLQRTNGEYVAVFSDKWSLRVFKDKHPDLFLETLVAAQL
jgi:peptide chain release factor 3